MLEKNIVLLHGWGASISKLKPLSDELTKLGWDTSLLKLPGFDKPTPESVWTLEDYAKYVLEFSEKQYTSYYLFGHSFGGRIAIKIAGGDYKSPHLTGIILCSAGGLSRTNQIKRSLFWILAKTGKSLLIYKPVADVWKRILYKIAREHDYEKADPNLREIFKKIVSEDLKSILPSIRYKTLIVWGDIDQTTPLADAQIIAQKVPGSKLTIFKGVGHRLPYDKPKEIADTINTWIQ